MKTIFRQYNLYSSRLSPCRCISLLFLSSPLPLPLLFLSSSSPLPLLFLFLSSPLPLSFQRFNGLFADRHLTQNRRFNSSKHHWSDNRVPVVLEVNQGSLDQVDPVSRRRICSYDYKEMEGIAQLTDYPGGVAVIYGGFSRLAPDVPHRERAREKERVSDLITD